MTPVSICVIMKNEEKNMEKFLSAIKRHFGNYPYELVLVDTGSTENTRIRFSISTGSGILARQEIFL